MLDIITANRTMSRRRLSLTAAAWFAASLAPSRASTTVVARSAMTASRLRGRNCAMLRGVQKNRPQPDQTGGVRAQVVTAAPVDGHPTTGSLSPAFI